MPDPEATATGHPSRRSVLGLALAGAAVPGMARTATARPTAPQLLYVSAWKGQSVYGFRFDPRHGTLQPLEAPAAVHSNWTTRHPRLPVLYVGDAADGGVVHSYSVDLADGALSLTSEVSTDTGGTAGGGIGTLSVDPESNTLLVANFEAGLAATVPIERDGRLGPVTSSVADTGSGPNPRQLGPRAHDVVLDPTGRFALVADFGADRVFIRPFDRHSGTLSTGAAPYPLAPGSGPRRLVFHPDGRTAYLLSELTAEIQTLTWHPHSATLTLRQSTSTDSAGFTGTPSGAELGISRDGRFVYASNRGENTLVVYATGTRGRLTFVQRLACGGTTPWTFALHEGGRWLLVANEASSTLDVFAVDPRSGRLSPTGTSAAVPNPASLTFVTP
jgi:6-phosphogluconolactonase (cycloisomerase 2 family)